MESTDLKHLPRLNKDVIHGCQEDYERSGGDCPSLDADHYFDIQRYEAEHQYYLNLACLTFTGSHQPYVKNYVSNALEEYGMAAAVLWLDR